MIAATMVYALIVALLCALAGIALERVAVARGMPRRGVWLASLLASVALPCFAIVSAPVSDSLPSGPVKVGISERSAGTVGAPITAVTPPGRVGRTQRAWWPAYPGLDFVLQVIWVGSSSAMCLFLLGGILYFRPRARGWSPRHEGGERLWIADRAGPAVFGFITPRIVIPRWLLDAPLEVRSLAIQHEREHIAGCDPLLLTAGLLLVSLAPWNVVLWWQLRRLRFAIEVDCDSRVLSGGVDAVTYGRALLSVGQKQTSHPVGAVALVEPVSQLEQRIRLMVANKSRHSITLTGVLVVLAASFGASAAALDPPNPLSTSDLHKAPPDSAVSSQLRNRFEALVKERYPQLLRDRFDGAPVVNILFNEDGSIAYSNYEISTAKPEVQLDTPYFVQHLHMAPESVGYVGEQSVTVPGTGTRIRIAFTQKAGALTPVLSVPDTRAVDFSLVERYFPAALQDDMPDQSRLWVLFDSDGYVLRTGQDSSAPAALPRVLEAEFPGIQTQFITSTPVIDANSQGVKTASGKTLQLFSIWLRKGSPLPQT